MPSGFPLGAIHGIELPYVFDSLPFTSNPTSIDGRVSAAVMGYWTAFASTGDPNGDDRPRWDRLDRRPYPSCLRIGDRITMAPAPAPGAYLARFSSRKNPD